MKLYYSPGACSLAVHIMLREIKANFDLEKVDLAKQETERGNDYSRINPKGYVPALKLEDGDVLTEAGVILQYLADQKPEFRLAPRAGTMERYRLMEWLTFISSEIHKTFNPFFHPEAGSKEYAQTKLAKRFDYIEKELAEKPWLTGDTFRVADIYLFVVTNWTGFAKIDISKWPKLKDFMARVAARPKVQEAMRLEGLGK